MKCVRCGAELKDKDRACIRCGAVNYNNPDNENYAKKYGNASEMKISNPSYMNKKVGLFPKILLLVMIIIIIVILFVFFK